MPPEIEPIAIVGMECVFPGAPNLAAFWRNIVRGISSVTAVPAGRWNGAGRELPRVPGGFIDGLTDFDPLAFGVMPAEVEEGDPEQFLVLSVIDAALRNMRGVAGKRGAPVASPENTEIVIGRGSYISNGAEHVYLRMEALDQVTELLGQILPAGSEGVAQEIRQRLLAGLGPVTPEVVACAMPNLTSGRAANRLNVMGRNYSVDAACASSLIAVDNVVRSLRERRCDLGIAAGVHVNQKPAFWMAFQTIGALSRSGVCRPYAEGGDGLLIGEGIGAVVLKRLSDALREGDRIYAAIRAVGVASDGRGAAIMTPRLEGECLAMRRAYTESGVDPQTVTLLEGHGTATVVGDNTEIDALHAVFGREGGSIALGSVKSMIGHAMPAAGMAGLIKTALAVYHRVLPATCGVERVHPKLTGSRISVNTASRPWVSPPELPRRAGINAFGFGGINAHVLVEEAPEAAPWQSLTPQSSELFLASAESPDRLREGLLRWRTAVAALRDEELGDLCFTASAGFSDAHAVRLAIVANSAADLSGKLERVQAAIAKTPDVRIHEASGIYYGASRYPGKLAFLFPGIGFPGLAGGYTERLAELYLHFPEVRRNLDLVDSVTRDDENTQPFSYQWFPPPLLDRKALQKIELDLAWSERSPMGMSMANLASWELLRSLGVDPDIMAGFSLGELSSLFASEVIDSSHFNLESLKPLRGIMRKVADSSDTDALWAMVATSAEQAEAMLRGVPGNVSVTMDVSPSQVFIGGEVAAVRAALVKFKEAGIWGQALPAFPLLMPYLTVHTEGAAPFEAKLREIVSTIPLGPGNYTVYSGTTATPYPRTPDAIREMMLAAVTRPVKVRDTISRLYADGVRIFVQLGAGGKMSANVENTLAGSDYVALSSDVAHRGGLEQLHHLLGHLAMLGRPFQPALLYRHRKLRRLDLENPAATPKTARKLSLAPPRLQLPPETAEWVRAQYAAAAPPPPPPETTRTALPPNGPRTSAAGQTAATMEQFLEVQRSWEQTETLLLQQFLDTQAATAAAVMRMRPAALAVATPQPFIGHTETPSLQPQRTQATAAAAMRMQPAAPVVATPQPFIGQTETPLLQPQRTEATAAAAMRMQPAAPVEATPQPFIGHTETPLLQPQRTEATAAAVMRMQPAAPAVATPQPFIELTETPLLQPQRTEATAAAAMRMQPAAPVVATPQPFNQHTETPLLQQPQVTQAAGATPGPFVGEIQNIVPGQELESRLVLDLQRHRFLSQHALLNIPDGLKPVEERMATLPLTFELEILSEVAEALMPGLAVTACHSMEARRWVSLESSATLEITIRARRVGEGEVEVELYTPGQKSPSFRGRATMGTFLPSASPPMEPAYDRPCPHTPAEFYARGPLFHGPMFRLMRNFDGMSDTQIGAHLEASGPEAHLGMPGAALIFEPLLLDALQQIVGYRAWLDGWFLMPVGMKRISRFGAPPRPGAQIRACVRYRKLDGRRVEADYEAYDSDGRPWIRVDSLEAWRVLSPKALLEANHRPREGYLAQPGPLDSASVRFYSVKVDNLGDLPPDWAARLYLRPNEWAIYQRRPALDWLLGRIAAKDAVRAWLRQHRNLLLHPLEVEIANHPDGAPRLQVPFLPALAVSIAHIENEAVAAVSEATSLGVDLAEVKERQNGFAGFAFRPDERACFPAGADGSWIHRAWCAKEAAAKAARLGIGQLPQFRIVGVDPETGAVEMEFGGIRLIAATRHEGDRAMAVVVP